VGKNLANITLKNNIIFGILFFFIFLIIGVYPLKYNENIRAWAVILSLVFLFITATRPNLFTFLNKSWVRFGILIGKIISPIVLGLVFFLIVVPTGIFVRLLKKDILGLKMRKSSYWIDRNDKLQTMKKQF
jgi:hypothetical protein|tara:strand:- start:3681 stop:4073 length:393 start_codon:yes stop_codon:yes gene_type:complete